MDSSVAADIVLEGDLHVGGAEPARPRAVSVGACVVPPRRRSPMRRAVAVVSPAAAVAAAATNVVARVRVPCRAALVRESGE